MPSSVAVKLPEDGTVRELPSQLPFPLPNTEEHRLEQIDQDEGGLYLDCELNDIRCQALIDTGASLSCVRLDISPDARTVTTVTGERAQIQGQPGQGSLCYITVENKRLCHDFCLADIQDECIIGLDLLERWGAEVDIPRACLYMDSHTIALQRRSVKKRKSNDGNIPPLEPPAPSPTAAVRQGNVTQAQPAAAAPPPVAPQPPVLTSVPPGPSEDIIEAVVALHQRSKEGLSSKQSHKLQDMLFSVQIRYIFADCTQTKLVQHEIDSDTADAHPITPGADWGEEVPLCHSVSGLL